MGGKPDGYTLDESKFEWPRFQGHIDYGADAFAIENYIDYNFHRLTFTGFHNGQPTITFAEVADCHGFDDHNPIDKWLMVPLGKNTVLPGF